MGSDVVYLTLMSRHVVCKVRGLHHPRHAGHWLLSTHHHVTMLGGGDSVTRETSMVRDDH